MYIIKYYNYYFGGFTNDGNCSWVKELCNAKLYKSIDEASKSVSYINQENHNDYFLVSIDNATIFNTLPFDFKYNVEIIDMEEYKDNGVYVIVCEDKDGKYYIDDMGYHRDIENVKKFQLNEALNLLKGRKNNDNVKIVQVKAPHFYKIIYD